MCTQNPFSSENSKAYKIKSNFETQMYTIDNKQVWWNF